MNNVVENAFVQCLQAMVDTKRNHSCTIFTTIIKDEVIH